MTTPRPSESRTHYRWQVVRKDGPIDMDEICCRQHAIGLLKAMLYVAVSATSTPTDEPCERCALPDDPSTKGSDHA